MAKANLKMDRTRLWNSRKEIAKTVFEDLKKDIHGKVKNYVSAEVRKFVDHAEEFVENGVENLIDEFNKKKESDLNSFNFKEFDPTGIFSLQTSVESATSLSQKASAWANVLGKFDPTGWVAAAAAFIHPKCSNILDSKG